MRSWIKEHLEDVSSGYPGRFPEVNDVPDQELHSGCKLLVLAELVQGYKRCLKF